MSLPQDESVDILMITYNRPDYTRLALERLLATCDEDMRVWLWHNGTHEPTLEVVRSLLGHPRVYCFHHSPVNAKIREPTNWLWSEAKGAFLSKVDDDCLMPEGWAATLRAAHQDVPQFGIIGCWRFRQEDFHPEIAQRKIQAFPGGHRILRNNWIEGSGYLMKRQVVDNGGFLLVGQAFTRFCGRAAAAGWINGWYYPFILQEHMDDPRSPHSRLQTDEDLREDSPLSASNFGITTIEDRVRQLRLFALQVQKAPIHPRAQIGWRAKLRRGRRRALAFGRRGLVYRFRDE